jgi:hypothetical protein
VRAAYVFGVPTITRPRTSATAAVIRMRRRIVSIALTRRPYEVSPGRDLVTNLDWLIAHAEAREDWLWDPGPSSFDRALLGVVVDDVERLPVG